MRDLVFFLGIGLVLSIFGFIGHILESRKSRPKKRKYQLKVFWPRPEKSRIVKIRRRSLEDTLLTKASYEKMSSVVRVDYEEVGKNIFILSILFKE
jgi:hypothetical protein